MPKLEDAFISMPTTGECELDIEKALVAFTPKCFISQWHDEYKVVKVTHKRNITVKAAISRAQALELIDGLSLKAIPSLMFNHAVTFRHPEWTPAIG